MTRLKPIVITNYSNKLICSVLKLSRQSRQFLSVQERASSYSQSEQSQVISNLGHKFGNATFEILVIRFPKATTHTQNFSKILSHLPFYVLGQCRSHESINNPLASFNKKVRSFITFPYNRGFC